MNAGFDLNSASKGAPFVGGSLQDVSSMTFAYQGVPFVVASQPPGARYVYDLRARLNKANFTNAQSVTYNLDAMGNRTSVVKA